MNYPELAALGEKELERQAGFRRRIFCCISTACLSAGAGQTHQAMEQAVAARIGDDHTVEVVKTGCMGLCSRGPLVRVETRDEPPLLYADVDPALAEAISAHHAPGGQKGPGRDADGAQAATLQRHVLSPRLPFFSKQVRVVLSETGRIDPESLVDCLAHGGYAALHRVLDEMTPKQVCDVVLDSGLRGRGGAGYPTGTKWHFVRRAQAASKYVIVNGDEGDPGAYMDRTVMEDDPHRVLEGMIIAAYAVGANSGYLYVRGEYPIAVKRLRSAILAARRHGILGRSVMGTDFNFDCEVRIGAGAFVCGEETALIHSVEGKRGMPRMRPPYPSSSGLWGAPTVINNVETMANVPSIILNGPAWYASIGTDKSKGTKVFALAGQLLNTGLIEVPMGISLREIVFDMGGGVSPGREFKAAQTGGPSGGCIPAEHLDTPVDYENLTRLGSIMGSGGLVIIDDATSMPEFARFFIDFCVDESCGKCVPCRVGLVQILGILDRLLAGQGRAQDLGRLEGLCRLVKTTSLCGLGQSAPNPVLSTLRFFRQEYDALIPQTSAEAAAGA